MVVVENGREHIGQQVSVVVTSVIQKTAGRMVFGAAKASRSLLPGGTNACENPGLTLSPNLNLLNLSIPVLRPPTSDL